MKALLMLYIALSICGCIKTYKNAPSYINNDSSELNNNVNNEETNDNSLNAKMHYSQKEIENALMIKIGDSKKEVIRILGVPQSERKQNVKGFVIGTGYTYIMTYNISDIENKHKNVALVIYLENEDYVSKICIISDSAVFITLKDVGKGK